jgi:hypothetical protein
MKKQKQHAFGKDVYLLGADKNGAWYWLEAPSWDCGCYWGFGYIETYTRNKQPQYSKDITSHSHANNFMNWCIEWNGKASILKETTFTQDEAWKLCELFKRFYLFKDLAELYYHGSAHITSSCYSMQDEVKAEEINKQVLPQIMDNIINILKP